MKIVEIIDALKRNIKLLRLVLVLLLAALAAGDAVFRLHYHGHYRIDSFPAFWAIFGAVGCFIMIKVAKGIAHLFLSKDEDYYG